MMTSSNGNILRVTGPLCGELTGISRLSNRIEVLRALGKIYNSLANAEYNNAERGPEVRMVQ